jgi:hypothetical protein
VGTDLPRRSRAPLHPPPSPHHQGARTSGPATFDLPALLQQRQKAIAASEAGARKAAGGTRPPGAARGAAPGCDAAAPQVAGIILAVERSRPQMPPGVAGNVASGIRNAAKWAGLRGAAQRTPAGPSWLPSWVSGLASRARAAIASAFASMPSVLQRWSP